MKNIKSNKAITLIALVITIVVLIILATVVINLSLGNNGIINKAKIATQEYKNAQDYEEEQIAKYSNEIDAIANGNRGTVTLTEEEYKKLEKDATTLIVNGNIPTKAEANNTWVKVGNYPLNYNKTDLYIKSFMCEVDGKDDVSYFGAQLQLRDDGIYYWANDFGRWGVPIMIFLGLR